MTSVDARDVPLSPASVERLAAVGLEYRSVDMGDEAQAVPFQRAVGRGFLGGEDTAEGLAFSRETLKTRRTTGVFDSTGQAAAPVATIDSWITPVTVPGGAQIDMWAISGVTVAATHRRRGIARSLLEGELRAAKDAGVAIAGLTVSEATIYGRYGFGPALPVAKYTVDTRRAGWGRFDPVGRLEYREREQLVDDLAQVHDRARRVRPGGIPGWLGRWQQFAGVAPAETDRDKVRGVRFVDEAGEVRGALAYIVRERHDTFRFGLDVRLLVAETADARAALWRFALQHDLVDEVTADLQAIDDPLPLLVADARGVKQEVHDHGWLRILDVPAALSARRYSAPIDLVLRIVDPLGFTTGDWALRADAAGSAVVESASNGEAAVTIGIAALSSLYVGGVRSSTLHGAGLIDGVAEAIQALDRAFSSYPAPLLDIWY